jgi:hypothetical protein
MKKILAVLAGVFVGAPVLAFVLVAAVVMAQTSQNYAFLRSRENVPVFGGGIRPTVTAEMGIPVGTPFFDTSTFALYYWSGSAWTQPLGGLQSSLATNAPDAASSIWGTTNRLTFEGATANAFETEITVTDPTADRLVTLPNTSGTAVLENIFNFNIPDSGDGNAATYTLQAAGYGGVTLSCADADGCTVTMGETGLTPGASVTITQIAAGSGNITIVDDDGTTSELDGDANLVLNTLDTVTLRYFTSYWVVTAYIDIS